MGGNTKRASLLILVVGCGSIGKRHIENLVELNAGSLLVFDERKDRLQKVKDKRSVETLDDLSEAWNRNPDAAVIAAPTSMHIPLALQAAEHGCHRLLRNLCLIGYRILSDYLAL